MSSSSPSLTTASPAKAETPIERDTRERLLDAAVTLFAEQGIAATRVAEIAVHAGVTPAMVHYYFKSRDQLLDTIVAERIERFIALIWDPITGSEDDPLALVKGLVSRILKASHVMPWLPPLWVREIVSEGGQLREKILQRIPRDKLRQLADCLKAGQEKGVVNPEIDPRLILISILGLTLLPLAAAKIWNHIPSLERVSKENLARHAISLLIGGLTNPAPGSVSKRG
jgi:AcrR family transcriptional regulator